MRITEQGVYAGTPEISGMRAKSAIVRVDAKHLFSELLLTRKNVHGKPCRIGVEAGDLVLRMFPGRISWGSGVHPQFQKPMPLPTNSAEEAKFFNGHHARYDENGSRII